MVLSGWTAPPDIDRVINSNGESTSAAAPEIKQSGRVHIDSDGHEVFSGTKRKLSELAEEIERMGTQPTSSKHVSGHGVPEDVGDNDDDDDLVMLDENPEKGKKKRSK